MICLHYNADSTVWKHVAIRRGRDLPLPDGLRLILAFRQCRDLSKGEPAQVVYPARSDAFYFGWFNAGTHGVVLWA